MESAVDMFNRAKEYIGKAVSLRTKSGMSHEGKLESVDIDGEITLRVTTGRMDELGCVFVNAESVESLSGPKVKK